MKTIKTHSEATNTQAIQRLIQKASSKYNTTYYNAYKKAIVFTEVFTNYTKMNIVYTKKDNNTNKEYNNTTKVSNNNTKKCKLHVNIAYFREINIKFTDIYTPFMDMNTKQLQNKSLHYCKITSNFDSNTNKQNKTN